MQHFDHLMTKRTSTFIIPACVQRSSSSLENCLWGHILPLAMPTLMADMSMTTRPRPDRLLLEPFQVTSTDQPTMVTGVDML